MRHNEFERRRRTLEEQCRADVELIHAGYRAKLHALETLWLASPEEEALAEPSHNASETPQTSETQGRSETPPLRTHRRGQVDKDVRAVLDRLPMVFDRGDVIQALGYEPPRATLFRVLSNLIRDHYLGLLPPATGGPRENMPARYRKVGAAQG